MNNFNELEKINKENRCIAKLMLTATILLIAVLYITYKTFLT